MADRPINWSTKERITAEKLNQMVDYTTTAINTASNAATTVRGYDEQFSNLQSNINNVSTIANRADSNATTANNAIDNAKGSSGSLLEKLNNMTTAAERYASETANQALINARNYTANQIEVTKTYIDQEVAKKADKTSLDATNTNVSDISTALGNLTQLRGGKTNLVTRLTDMDSDITNVGLETDRKIAERTVTITALNEVKERLDRVDGGRVDTTSTVVDNHAVRLGNLEKEIINDPTTGSSNIKSNVAALLTEVNNAHRAAQSGQTADTLKSRFEDIEERLNSLDGGEAGSESNSLVDIVTAIRSELNAAHRAVEEGQPADTIVDRFIAIENNIASIATELGMLNAGVIEDTNSRIDTIAEKVGNLEDEIGNLDSSRIDQLYSTIEDEDSGLSKTKQIADEALTKANAAAVASTVNESLTSLDERLDAIDGGEKLEGNTLNSRVSTLETTVGDSTAGLVKKVNDLETAPKSATKVIDVVAYDSEGNPILEEEPSENVDYLLKNGDKYYYWKYINETWQLISSGGGGEAELPDEIINEIGVQNVQIENSAEQDKWPTEQSFSGGLVAYAAEDTEKANNLLGDFVAVRNARIQNIYDSNNEVESQKLQVLDTNGKLMEYDIVGGGGSGTANLYNARIDSTTPASRSIPSNSTDPVTISAKVLIQQGNTLLPNATAEGNIQYRRRGTTAWNTGDRIEVKANNEDEKYIIPNDTIFNINITKYLEEDITMEFRIRLTVYPTGEETDAFQTYSSTFRVTRVNISIVDESFNYGSVKNSNFLFPYRCFGQGITKTVHFLLDGEEATTNPVTTNSHNETLSQLIPIANILKDKPENEKNGMHTFQVYFVTEAGLESNRLNYYILYNTDNERLAPMIGASAKNTSIMDGDELVVNYSVNTIGSETTDKVEIELYTMNGQNKNSIQTDVLTDVQNNKLIDPPYKTFNYPSLRKEHQSDPDPDPITVYVKFTATHNNLSDSQTIAVQINYLDTSYKLTEETDNLIFKYSAYGRSNNNAGKEKYTYTYTTPGGQNLEFIGTFNNFNWATDGYVDGESLIIGGGATLNINVPIFSTTFNNVSIETSPEIENITTNGRTIEIDYEVLSTTDLKATIIDCMSTGTNPTGFRVTPQNCYLLNSGSNIDIDETGFIKNEESVAAAYLNPGTRTHLTFVIEPISTVLAADGTYHQSTNIYVNGEFANSCPYNITGNDFNNNATITIGSDTCLIKLYSIKLYNRGLTTEKVLHNYAVAPVATRDKIVRLEHNDVLNDQGLVDYEKARKKYTCLLLTGMGTVNGVQVPTMAPYKGYPSVVGRQKDGDTVGKTESGLLLTKPDATNNEGYSIEFNLQDKLIDPNNLYGYASSNNVQGTSSQKFPVKNLKIYLAKGDDDNVMVFDENENISVKQVYKYSINTAAAAAYRSIHGDEAELPTYITDCGANISTLVKNLVSVPTQNEVVEKIKEYLAAEEAEVGNAYDLYSTGDELIIHPIKAYKKSKKVKYALKEAGIGESTLCWKADYMSTDHANTFNANIANTLYSAEDRLSDRWTDQTQFTVYGIKCLLFQQNGDSQPEFVGDGCLNNDKGNHKTFGLEAPNDKDDDTMCQKWDFRNNTGSLLYFKHDGLFQIIDNKPAIARELECIYPDEGDLADINKVPNYNHFQILSSWLGNRANYWYEHDASKRADKKQIFINEFKNHFNFNHILIYYLFMEYTALCDNRVKNIHMRTDNAGEERIKIKDSDSYYFEGNSNPNSGPWTLSENLETRIMQEPIMDDNGDYQFDENGNMKLGNIEHVFVKDSVINSIDWEQGDGHSNFAIWAPVLYDLDSCFSADNVGYLKIRYDADWDYSLYNKLKFAGFDSILWLQVEDCFQQDLKDMAKKLYNYTTGLKYSVFYRQQITDNLASLCPAIVNQDMILKYDKPWTDGFLDYTKDPPAPSTDKYKYLQRGTRTGQKAIFMKQRSLFLASKYDGNEFLQDKITFRAGTQVNHDNSVLTLVANQKLYPGAQFGDVNDTTKVTRRANKVYDFNLEDWKDINEEEWVPEFTPCQIQHSGNMNNTDGIEIYGASVLNDIGDISRFHPWQVKIGNAVNLKKLILGSDAIGYSNTSTDDIDGLNSCVLLEEINVCNLKNLTSLQLSNNGFIKKVYAIGSGLNTIALPRGGVLDTIAYGENITDITIINQSRLTNFSYENSENNNYANVTRLWIENTPNVPIIDIITKTIQTVKINDDDKKISHLTNGIRLIGINIELEDDPYFLEILASDLMENKFLSSDGGRKDQTPQITGRIGINKIRASLLNKIRERYGNDLIIDVHQQTVTENTIRFYNGETLYKTFYLTADETIPEPTTYKDPVTGQIPPLPQKEADRIATYTFANWKTATGQILESGMLANNNYTFYAQYSQTPQLYTLVWKDGGTTLTSIPNLTYNQSLIAYTSPSKKGTGNLKLNTVKNSNGRYYAFKGWDKALTILNEENFELENNTAVVNAIWEESTIDFNNEINIMDFSQLNAADLYGLGQLNGDIRQNCLENYRGTGTVNFTLGHDFNYSNITSKDLLSGQTLPYVLNGNVNRVITYNNTDEIYPLKENESFTLALDFTMLQDAPSSVSETILASCYYNNNNTTIHGFKITYDVTNSQIRVYWGDNTNYTTIEQGSLANNDGYRNIVVLSHEANSNVLNVYYRKPISTNALPGEVIVDSLTIENYTPIDVPLILGGNYLVNTNTGEIQNIIENDDRSYVRRPAKAQIHFMKYWYAALRSDDCNALATWPHEEVSFVLTGYDNGSTSIETNTITVGRSSKLNFASVSVIGDRGYLWSSNSSDIAINNVAGWHNSSIKNYCQTVIYAALPTTLQSILYTNQIPCVLYEYVNNSSGYPQWQRVQALYTDSSDIYLPSAKELGDLTNNEANLRWPTTLGNDITVYKDSSVTNRAEEGTLTDELLSQIQKARFYGKQVKFNNVIFTTTNDPSGYNYNNASIVLEEGNYWLRSADQTMYVYSNNSWKPAIIWSTRTIILRNSADQLSPQNFERISQSGILSIPSGGYNSVPDTTRGVCIEFAIGGDSV